MRFQFILHFSSCLFAWRGFITCKITLRWIYHSNNSSFISLVVWMLEANLVGANHFEMNWRFQIFFHLFGFSKEIYLVQVSWISNLFIWSKFTRCNSFGINFRLHTCSFISQANFLSKLCSLKPLWAEFEVPIIFLSFFWLFVWSVLTWCKIIFSWIGGLNSYSFISTMVIFNKI